MKISELIETKKIKRPTKYFDENGSRIYEEIEFKTKFDLYPVQNYTKRIFAKLLDFIPFYILFHFGFNQEFFFSIIYSIPCVLIFNAFLESKISKSIGKSIVGLNVVDQYGESPNILKSLKRNLLCFANLCPVYFGDILEDKGWYFTKKIISLDLNNRLSKTYVIENKELNKIKLKMKNKNVT